ncbi:MAG TPA: Zn-dependent hydrolase [Fusobacterium sp.]|uniref:Zn-dependent hydrolase n=1 Tax=Fusobacterium sp. TaxID=68766 RepID=UPI002F40E564
MYDYQINRERLLRHLQELGNMGRRNDGELSRLVASDVDKLGRDLVVKWMKELGLDIKIDRIGNVFGVWSTEENQNKKPVFIGSHIDSVINAGIYDGCYGVLSGIEVIQTLKENEYKAKRPIVVSFYTNEEGVRYQPDMMGSLVYAGGLDVETALKSVGTDGSILREELKKIGYYGENEPGFIQPHSYIELHVEQGPILDQMKIPVGAVENLQGISWQKITVEGVANHAGTTPMYLRKDAGYVAAAVNVFLHDMCIEVPNSVATVGTISYEPNAVNVIPSKAIFTVDLRNPDSKVFKELENRLDEFLNKISMEVGSLIHKERLVRFEPVTFNQGIVEIIEKSAKNRDIVTKRMTSGAGHDAQMMSRICPTAMIFVPSLNGISHNPKEFTEESDLENGANILLDVVVDLSSK